MWLVGLLIILVAVPGGALVVVVQLDRKRFYNLIRDEVARQLSDLRPDLDDAARTKAAEIVAAQAALETNWGSTPAWKQGWNFGNITAGSSWTGPVVEGGDTEPNAAGVYVPITQRFRKYGSLAEAVSNYFTLLSWPGYQPARDALFRGDANGFAAQLRQGGYYTAPLADYQGGIASALRTYGSGAA
jgi:flagellum-specific peptidoglycan hydrolase FlgJ